MLLLKVTNIRLPIQENQPLEQVAAKRLGLPAAAVERVFIQRQALDARRKNNICLVYTLLAEVGNHELALLRRLKGDKDICAWKEEPLREPLLGKKSSATRPVIVGAGPAGLAAALTLAEYGHRPLLLERGQDVDARSLAVQNFWRTGRLEEESNIQFGEGGAGTFSDGKLTTRVTNPLMRKVLELFIQAGAPEEIAYQHKPHLGTDQLRLYIKAMRRRIQEAGGEVRFSARVAALRLSDGRVRGLVLGSGEEIEASAIFLAIGHSARDTYAALAAAGIALEPKPFAIGVRIEHLQEQIDRAQYGALAGHPRLGPADYALVYQDKRCSRAVYSFCMCPGGLVVAAASESGGVVTNGMSFANRGSRVANSALVVNVTPADFGDQPLAGVEFQRHYERLAYAAGGGDYRAPAESVGHFLGRVPENHLADFATYRPGLQATELRACLPDFVVTALGHALPALGHKLRGFDIPEAILTGVETRTSAPLRILRGTDYQSINTAGLYPLGEGAGYAGGIMSAAADGLAAARAYITEWAPAL